jgi:hypothetical protein
VKKLIQCDDPITDESFRTNLCRCRLSIIICHPTHTWHYTAVSSSASYPAGAITAVTLRLEVAADGVSSGDAAQNAAAAADRASEAVKATVDSGDLRLELALRGISTGVVNGRVLNAGADAVTNANTTAGAGGGVGVGGGGSTDVSTTTEDNGGGRGGGATSNNTTVGSSGVTVTGGSGGGGDGDGRGDDGGGDKIAGDGGSSGGQMRGDAGGDSMPPAAAPGPVITSSGGAGVTLGGVLGRAVMAPLAVALLTLLSF